MHQVAQTAFTLLRLVRRSPSDVLLLTLMVTASVRHVNTPIEPDVRRRVDPVIARALSTMVTQVMVSVVMSRLLKCFGQVRSKM